MGRECPYCGGCHTKRKGLHSRKWGKSRARVQRYYCHSCKSGFCELTGTLFYRERKPEVTVDVAHLLKEGVSQAGCVRLLRVKGVTVDRKLCRLGKLAAQVLKQETTEASTVVFDEMETFEHTKCKPVAIVVAVSETERKILAADVASMPAKGKLAKIARRRYGKRQDDRPFALTSALKQIKEAARNLRTLKSDRCPRYPSFVKDLLPTIRHLTFKGRRGCVVGQGELKRGGFDPLFSLNHTCAMFRDRLKCLTRRTWCTSKRLDRLQMRVHLYACFHNAALALSSKCPALPPTILQIPTALPLLP